MKKIIKLCKWQQTSSCCCCYVCYSFCCSIEL